MFEFLFVPQEQSINSLIEVVTSKFRFIDSIKIAISSFQDTISNIGGAPVMHLTLDETKYTEKQEVAVIDMRWYAPFKSYGDVILTGFIYAFFLWRLFIRLPSTIHGIGGITPDIFKIYKG